VVDLDGVVADVRHRLHHLDRRPKDWAGFFAAAPDDPPLTDGVQLVLRLADDHEIVYLTGRPESCRRDTVRWLSGAGLPAARLIMRRRGDFRPARVTKVDVLERLSQERPVALLVDDDDAVVGAARAAGYQVVHADWMPDEPTLFDAQEREGRT
jgi:hypothetical protein